MGSFGDFYNKKRKKLSKEEMAKKAAKGQASQSFVTFQPQLVRKGKKQETLA